MFHYSNMKLTNTQHKVESHANNIQKLFVKDPQSHLIQPHSLSAAGLMTGHSKEYLTTLDAASQKHSQSKT